MKYLLLITALIITTLLSAQDIVLPQPTKEGGMPLMEALNLRQSTKEYVETALTEQQLSDLLWSAFGYNREGQIKRTAPSGRNRQEIQLYVALPGGMYLYDAKANILKQKAKGDHRESTGRQGFVQTAALSIVYVADYVGTDQVKSEGSLQYSHAHVGFISQNVYLYCASAGLGTVVRGSFDAPALMELLQLPEENAIVLVQTVGVPK